MHCKTTCPLPVINNLLTCSFYGFYTVNVLFSEILIKSNIWSFFYKHSHPTIWSDQRENVSLYLFIVGRADWGLLLDQRWTLYTTFLYTFIWLDVLFFLFCHPLEASQYCLCITWKRLFHAFCNMSQYLWCLFDLWALWFKRLIFYFPGEGRRFLSEALKCPTGTRGWFPWSKWELLMGWADTWCFDSHCDVLHCKIGPNSPSVEEQRPEEHVNTSSFTFIVNPAETK